MFRTSSSARALWVTLLVCGLFPDGNAQQALEEIIVTASFRERERAAVPASVTVFDRQAVEETAVQHFEELVFAVPNLNWSGDGNRARYLQIRGVGELEQYEGAPNPSVGFLIDDIDFSGIGTVATLFDVSRIEVLRGPQGSRYGANALAGLVYVRSTEPTDEFSGDVRLTGGQDGLIAGGLALGGPVAAVDSLRYRVSAHYHESDGFRDNSFLDRSDTNGRQELTLRGKLAWETESHWAFRLAGLYVDIDDGYDAFAIDNSLTVLSDNPGRDAQESAGASLRATWSGAERWTFTSITSYADSSIDFSFDADWGNPSAWAPYTYDFATLNERQRKTLSQEFRLASADDAGPFGGRADWLVGAYLLRLDERYSNVNRGIYLDPFIDFELAIDTRLDSRYESLSAALFGQLVVGTGEGSELTFGLRVEERSTDYGDSAGLSLGPGETMLGGEIAWSLELGDSATGYVSLSKGFKAGGFNLGPVPEGRREFDQEELWNLEAGLKATGLEGRLSLDAAVFYAQRRDQQVRTSFQLVPNDPASFVFYTDNAARGTTLGAEADLRWLPAEGVELYANLGLLRAEFDRFVTPEVDLSGREQAHAPGYSLAFGGVFRHPRGAYVRVDLTARDEYFFDVSHDQQSDPFELVKARVGYETERWSIELWARNLLDENYAVRGFYFGNEPPDFPPTLYVRRGDPRQIGITLDARF